MLCPNCDTPCERDEVDVGVGIVHGPWGCWNCGWSEYDEYEEYDLTKRDGHTTLEDIERDLDPLGGFIPCELKQRSR